MKPSTFVTKRWPLSLRLEMEKRGQYLKDPHELVLIEDIVNQLDTVFISRIQLAPVDV